MLTVSHLSYAQDWLEAYFGHIQQQAQQSGLPGMAMVVSKKGEQPSYFVHGQTHKNGDNITPKTVFRLASVSKTFTAALMAKEVEKQKIQWQTPLYSLAPQSWKQDELTLTHLLSQSSGYTPNAYDNLIEANYSRPRVLKALKSLSPLCQPSRCYTYQNALFGLIEEYYQHNNSSFSQALQQQIFTPLNMTNASVGAKPLQENRHWARPHVAIQKGVWRQGKIDKSYYRFSPAAGVNASAEDMHKWLQAMMGEANNLLSLQQIAHLTTPHTNTKKELKRRDWRGNLQNASYGLGWRIYDFNGLQLIYHGGWVKGYRADIAFAPKAGIAMAILMNAEANQLNEFSVKFWQDFTSNAFCEACVNEGSS